MKISPNDYEDSIRDSGKDQITKQNFRLPIQIFISYCCNKNGQ